MCGIIGYVGEKNVAPIVLAGLRRLEYRGYDSAGIAVISKGCLERRRSVGKVELLSKMLEAEPLKGTVGIGHTRWATHGKPSQDNAHPHTDCEGKVVVVHNGIIENYMHLRERLLAKGHKFSSETDTEVIAHLMEENLKRLGSGGKALGDVTEPLFFEAVRQTVKEMEGAYAVGILWAGCPGTIIGARKQSPLVVGVGNAENFLASDVSAFLEHTKKAVFLNDGEIAILNAGGVKLFNLEGKKCELSVTTIQWDQTMAEKGGYKHFMLKEIHEQPGAVEDTLRGTVLPLNDATMKAEFGFDSELAKKIEKIQIVACGTAYHAGMVGEYVIEHFSGIPVHVDLASEFRYREAPTRPNTLLIAISQSGETADTLAAVRENKKLGGIH
ncbi:MAG TPA: glutamine--fructose-6-phosphate transaminase (isomerizing), partial [Elusimicrobiales bacterium]|nr:glutamine--fructose-6-phosphate transaminase (isomerizing) [Elusimicrobiales bacterium]